MCCKTIAERRSLVDVAGGEPNLMLNRGHMPRQCRFDIVGNDGEGEGEHYIDDDSRGSDTPTVMTRYGSMVDVGQCSHRLLCTQQDFHHLLLDTYDILNHLACRWWCRRPRRWSEPLEMLSSAPTHDAADIVVVVGDVALNITSKQGGLWARTSYSLSRLAPTPPPHSRNSRRTSAHWNSLGPLECINGVLADPDGALRIKWRAGVLVLIWHSALAVSHG
ncbi:hypothetical protein C8R43DRAFT_1127388 [Mycena crocata]|nr:hypothetical protein C8R43DRAFT_1127388 [Mycena crocata]